MSALNQLSGGAFQTPVGNLLANGYLIMQLSQDARVNGTTQVVSGYKVKINLDGSGNVVASPSQSVWPNDALTPAGTFYIVTGYSSNGLLVWGPNSQQVLSSPSPFNIGAWIPSSVNLATGGGGGGSGTVTSFSFTNANGIMGSVSSPTTTPNLTLALGAITPTSVTINGSSTLNGTQGVGSKVLTFTGSTGANQVLVTDSSGTAELTGISAGNLVQTTANNVFTGVNNFTNNTLVSNVNAATSGANQSSPFLELIGNAWNGTASIIDQWTIQNVLSTGTNPISTLTLNHTGPGGGTISFGTSIGTAQIFTGQVQCGGAVVVETDGATSGANLSSPDFVLIGSYWNGSAAAGDRWEIQNVLGTGTNPTSTLSFRKLFGTPGASFINLNTDTVVSGQITANTLNLASPTTATSATAGAATALPATPLGYVEIVITGTTVKIPYYTV